MNMFFKKPTYVLLFACCLMLVLLFFSALAASLIVDKVVSNKEIKTRFNFPRVISETEMVAPEEIQGAAGYTMIRTDAKKRGTEINWNAILKKGPYDVVVISDSFLATDHGKNLLKELSVRNNVTVLHIFTNNIVYSANNPFRMLVLLTNNGYIKKTGAKYVILETAERTLPDKIKNSGSLTDSKPLPQPAYARNSASTQSNLSQSRNTISGEIERSSKNIDNYLNQKVKDAVVLKTWLKNDILSILWKRSNDGSFYFEPINESRFTSTVYHSRLIFFEDDIGSFHNRNTTYPEDCIEMNNRLNTISRKLEDQNVSLLFMPAVSAYNTYYPYIIDPPTARNPLFEILRELNHTYVLVDTKAIVNRMQLGGEKDLSGIGDPAHWTWKVSEAIAQEIDLHAKPGSDLPAPPQDEYDRAVRAFRSVIYERGESDDPWALGLDGRIYEKQSDYLNATRCYQRSLDLDPRQPDVRRRLGNLSGAG
jgi:tetratricopeptide (TPR) repeat protein